jgi:hypothetical protein
MFQNLLTFLLNHIPVSWNCDIYQHTCSFFIVAYYNVWLVIGDGAVSLYLLVPQYGWNGLLLLLLLLLLLVVVVVVVAVWLTAIELSLGDSTDKTSKKTYTWNKQYKNSWQTIQTTTNTSTHSCSSYNIIILSWKSYIHTTSVHIYYRLYIQPQYSPYRLQTVDTATIQSICITDRIYSHNTVHIYYRLYIEPQYSPYLLQTVYTATIQSICITDCIYSHNTVHIYYRLYIQPQYSPYLLQTVYTSTIQSISIADCI